MNLLSLLIWLDRHPHVPVILVGVLITLAGGWAVRSLWHDEPGASRGPDWVWWLLLTAILAAGRWPSFIFTRELDVDESQLLAGAHALTRDPVFWRSVCGGTAGPLDFFALWPAGWLCGWDSFLTARLTAAGLLAGSLILAHQVMARTLGRPVARIATLAAASFEALTQAADFLHYSTELVPVALLGAAAYAATRRWDSPTNALWNGLGGLALGAVPFGKLQPAPLAALIGLVWVIAEWRSTAPGRRQCLSYLFAGALLPAALFAWQLTLAGEWENFVRSYLVFNFLYAGESQGTVGTALKIMLGNALLWDRLLPITLLATGVWLAALVRLRGVADPVIRLFTRAAGAFCLVTLAIILLPKRPYLHYGQFLLLPVTFLLGVMLARVLASAAAPRRKTERWFLSLSTAGVIGTMLAVRIWSPNWFIGDMAYYWHFPRTELALRVAACARPGESLAIWGRADHLYVETGLRQATRDSHFGAFIEPGPLQQYTRERYLADFLRAAPALFLDAVGPASPHFNDAKFAHEREYPELAAAIRAGYVQVAEYEGARVYRRRNLLGR